MKVKVTVVTKKKDTVMGCKTFCCEMNELCIKLPEAVGCGTNQTVDIYLDFYATDFSNTHRRESQ